MRRSAIALATLLSITNFGNARAQANNPSPSAILSEYAEGVTKYISPPSNIKLGHGDIWQPDLLKATDDVIYFNVTPYSWPKGNEYLQRKYLICDRQYRIGWSTETPDGSIWAQIKVFMAKSPSGWVVFRPSGGPSRFEFWGGGDHATSPLYPGETALLSDASDRGERSSDFKIPTASGVCTTEKINGKPRKVVLLHAIVIAQDPVKPEFNNRAIVIKAKQKTK